MRNRPVLTSSDADAIMAAARTEARENNWHVTIAIVDDGGHLLQLSRGDGAPLISVEVAGAKARTAALTRRATAATDEIARQNPGLYHLPGMLVLPGGVPIIHAGECIGAVGVSGVQGHEDAQVATAGVAALGSTVA